MPFRLMYEKQTFLQFLSLFFLQENSLRCSMEIWQTGEVFVRKVRKILFKFRQKWLEFSKTKKIFSEKFKGLQKKFLTNIKFFSAQTSKMIQRKISIKNITASNVSSGKWNEVLTTLPKFFWQKTKHFLTAVKNQYGSINFGQKVYGNFEFWYGHKKSSFDRFAR